MSYIRNFENYLRGNKSSENTIKSYISHIEKFMAFVGKAEEEITMLDVDNYLASISNLSSGSVKSHISSIKSYFNFLSARFNIDNVTKEMKNVKANPKQKPYVNGEVVEKILSVCASLRDRAFIKFMVSTGLRISEASAITVDAYYKAINSNREIQILGKGAKWRKVYINKSSEEAIDDYLSDRRVESKFLFATNRGTPISDRSFNNTIKLLAKKAGIPEWEDMSAHCLRSGYATIMVEHNVDIEVIRVGMGHSSLATTGIYVKGSQIRVNQATASVNF